MQYSIAHFKYLLVETVREKGYADYCQKENVQLQHKIYAFILTSGMIY